MESEFLRMMAPAFAFMATSNLEKIAPALAIPTAPATSTLASDTSLSLDYPTIENFLEELSNLPKAKPRNMLQYVEAFHDMKFFDISEIVRDDDPKDVLSKIGMPRGDANFFLEYCKKRCLEITSSRE
jgi:hypothetical protein